MIALGGIMHHQVLIRVHQEHAGSVADLAMAREVQQALPTQV